MLPFAAPHWPIQCSKEDREKYKVSVKNWIAADFGQGMYDDGPTALRDRRVAALKKLGIIHPSVVPHEMIDEAFPGKKYRQWEEMTPEERAKSARAMETYAGMVDCMDRCIGKVMQYLDDSGLADGKFPSLCR